MIKAEKAITIIILTGVLSLLLNALFFVISVNIPLFEIISITGFIIYLACIVPVIKHHPSAFARTVAILVGIWLSVLLLITLSGIFDF